MQAAAEWLGLLLTVWTGVVFIAVGSCLGRRSPVAARRAAVALVVLTVALGAAHHQPLKTYVGEALSVVGGEGVAACWSLLALLGVISGMARKQARRWLLVVAACLAFGVLITLSAAPLYWRFAGDPLRQNVVDSDGVLQQSTGMTCGPAAAAMLAWKSGVRVSEGELAERAGTNPLVGTDEYALARALASIAGDHASAYARSYDLATAKRIGLPFVAYVRREDVGGHAILVEKIGDSVETIDPLSGSRDKLSTADFEREWTGVGIWLTIPARALDERM